MGVDEKRVQNIGWPLELVVFSTGALVMIFEITGSRIVAPFLGNSTYIWTSLIGVILAALSIGYWIGGSAADRRPSPGLLSSILFGAGGLVSLTVLSNEIVLSFISAAPFGLACRSFIASVILFAPASILFGFVLPFAAKLRLLSLKTSGKTTGRLYALSTIGSIVGTFAAGFFLIPFVGSLRTLYLVAATLFVLGFVVAPFVLKQVNVAGMILLLIAVGLNEGVRAFRYSSNRLVDLDTEYARIAIFETVDARSGDRIRAIANDPYFLQSAIYLDRDDLVFGYTRFFHIARAFVPDPQHSLVIGGAGYSFPQDHLKTFPDSTLEVVEIDPQMTEVARRYFRLQDNTRLNIIHEDARTYLRRTQGKRFDVIFMDAFGSLFSVPTHLTTIEAMRSVATSLNDKGVLVMNLGGALTGDGSGFLRAEIATLKLVFEHVRIFKVDATKRDDEMQNLVIVAGSELNASADDPGILQMLRNEYTEELELTLPALTDDVAPVEYYNSIAQDLYIAERRN